MAWLTSRFTNPAMRKRIWERQFWEAESQSPLQQLVYEKQIALDVAVTQQSLILGSIFKCKPQLGPE